MCLEHFEQFVVWNPAWFLLSSKNVQPMDMLEEQLELIADTLIPSRGCHSQMENLIGFD